MSKSKYAARPNLFIGFHGCDKSLVERLALGQDELRPSCNGYDWLGDGIYFWENNVTRAFEFAEEKQKRNPDVIKEPGVIGAVLYLKDCLDLTDRESLLEMEKAYTVLVNSLNQTGNKIPKNSEKMLLRPLDCSVIKSMDHLAHEIGTKPYDTIRGSFFEGDPVYPNAGVYKKNHIQICIRNSECILGYFIPKL
jgi:hypothetical protein